MSMSLTIAGTRGSITDMWKLLLVMLLGCGGSVVTGDDDAIVDGGQKDGGGEFDADPTVPDADPGAPDAASTGLALGASCDVFLDECADGGTCRLVDSQGHDGQCRVVGDQPAGSQCSVPTPFYSVQPCGEAMICNGSQPDGVCQVMCDPTNPDARCASNESCAEITDGVGVCY